MEALYYTVKQIREKENCGRDRAYDIAKMLPHEKRGRDIYVFAEDYEKYYQAKREEAIKNSKNKADRISNVFQIKKFKYTEGG